MTWKPIPNHEGYEVSDSGDVRSWLPRNGGGAEVADDLALPANTVRKVIATHNIRARKEGKPIVSFKGRRTRSLALET